MTRLLVANRGEIARRIFRTARRMGIATVAVYSDADASLPFVREADLALRLGPAPASASYLDIERVLAAARESEADLIHPGYGFLAESPAFANAVDAAGLRFVGPSAKVMSALGDKANAKDIARRAGVPTLPGHASEDQRDETFIAAAKRIGYPVIVKPMTASDDATAMSAIATSPAPPPSAAPCTRTTRGIARSSSAANISASARESATFCARP